MNKRKKLLAKNEKKVIFLKVEFSFPLRLRRIFTIMLDFSSIESSTPGRLNALA